MRVAEGIIRDAAQADRSHDEEGKQTVTLEFGLDGPYGLENKRTVDITLSAALMLFGEIHTALVGE